MPSCWISGFIPGQLVNNIVHTTLTHFALHRIFAPTNIVARGGRQSCLEHKIFVPIPFRS